MGMSDLERLQPEGRTLVVSGGNGQPLSFPSTQLWQTTLAAELRTAKGKAAISAMSLDARAYVANLTRPALNAASPPSAVLVPVARSEDLSNRLRNRLRANNGALFYQCILGECVPCTVGVSYDTCEANCF